MGKSAIVLAGGFSTRFGREKALVLLADKPLLEYVLDAIGNIVEEKIVVVSSKAQIEIFAKALRHDVEIVVDAQNVRSPLVGALTGFRRAHEEYSLLLPCDTPFVSRDTVLFLFDICMNKTAVIPRWPNGYIEPLQAVYHTKSALEAAQHVLSEGKLNMLSMVDRLKDVRYVSTFVLQQLDPELRTFFNVNTPLDLKKAESTLKH